MQAKKQNTKCGKEMQDTKQVASCRLRSCELRNKIQGKVRDTKTVGQSTGHPVEEKYKE